eukprot:13288.XXX_936882_940044_1 [CDS] Oithona nana genome sequencing.
MINYCPEGTSNLNVIEKCQEDTGYLQAIPVHSRDTDLVYSNIFCALCHDDVNLTISRGTVRCNNEDLLKNCGISPFDHILLPEFHLKNTLTWTRLLGQFGKDPLNNCSESQSYSLSCKLSLDFDVLDVQPQIRSCSATYDIIDSCPDGVYDFCQLYYLNVNYQGKTYSNPHCAQCHGIPLNTTQCSTVIKAPRSSSSIATKTSKLQTSTPRKFMTNDFSLTQRLPLVELDFLNSQHNCDNGFWDPLANRCYNTTCGYHYQFQNGHCLFRNISKTLQCPQKNEFHGSFFFSFQRELSNGSIFHKRHKTLFNREDYEIYHFQVGELTGGGEGFDRVYKVCSTESLINVSIIQGAVGSTVLYASVICLSIHIFIYTAIKKLRKPPAQNLLALTCALCPGQLLLVLALSNNTSHSICIATATFLHYFFLVAAFWMNVLHFDLCRVCFKRCFLNKVSSTAREASRAKFRFKLYSYYAWGIPILLVTSGHVSGNFQALDNYNPHYATNYCWINGKNGLAMYLALPMATLLLENGLFIAVTVICLLQNHRQVYIQGIHNSTAAPDDISRQRKVGLASEIVAKAKQNGVKFKESEYHAQMQVKLLIVRFGSYGLLGLVLGLPWILAFAIVFSDTSDDLWYPFVILQGLQGVTIFLLFDLKRKIYYLIFEKIMGKPHPSVRRHRLLKAPGHVISSVVATSSLQATTNSAVQKSVKSQASSGVDIDDDADAV